MTVGEPLTLDIREVQAFVETRTVGDDVDQVLVLKDDETTIEFVCGVAGLTEQARRGAVRIASAAWALAGIRPLEAPSSSSERRASGGTADERKGR